MADNILDRTKSQTRAFLTDIRATRADEGNPDSERFIEGYFSVCGVETELWQGAFEEIAPGAFDETLGNDIRALINHNTTLVLGRNKSGTLELRADSHGLWGRIKINSNDVDAVNLHERVKRGDVDQCSFGFNIIEENIDFREDGSIKWTITKIDLHEVSVCTFPAYTDTGVQARKLDYENLKSRRLEQRKLKLKERMKSWQLNN
ncbi:MAG: HK97 family phage prohead protease [Anaerofustis sp.]